jgi:hypothetical protein
LISTAAGPDGLDAADEGGLVRGAADGKVLPPPEELHAVITTRAASTAPALVRNRHTILVS